jgi:AcrR family transcriptional regulator
MRLFSERGYRSTTVADIQHACGMSRSSGGLYRHFRSKREVLEAGIEREVQHVEALRIVSALGKGLGELRPEVEILGRFVLIELGAERELLRILLREADQFPDLLADARERLVRPVYDLATN